MSVSYTNSSLISIERRFDLNTKQMGLILAATELGHIAMAIFTAHFFGNRHRPRWICFGTILMGFALILFALPEWFFPKLVLPPPQELCSLKASAPNGTQNTSDNNIPGAKRLISAECGHHGYGSSAGAIAVLCVAHVLHGFGSTTPMVLGFPYLDDNMAPKNTPTYYGYALFGRLFGPLLGFALGSICLTVYYDFSKPLFPPNDPRWISAWYIGFIAIGIGLLIFGGLMALFPAELPPSKLTRKKKNEKEQLGSISGSTTQSNADLVLYSNGEIHLSNRLSIRPPPLSFTSAHSWKLLLVDLKRLFTNLAFVCRTTSMFVDGMVIAGIFNYFPKYYSQQFQISQSRAAVFGGLIQVIAVISGIIIGSILIKRLALRPRTVALSLVVPSMILSAGLFIAIGIGCDIGQMFGLPSIEDFRAGHGDFNENACEASRGCGCSRADFKILCEPRSATMFYSPCFAGCTEKPDNKTKAYQNCGCAALVSLPILKGGALSANETFPAFKIPDLVPGMCAKNCNTQLIGLTVLLFLAVFFEGMPMPGQIMIQFRVVDVDLKNLCAGVTSLLVAAFGLLPAPIFVGAIVDSTCRLWQTTECGERGACAFYDTDQFRWKFFMTGGFLKLITVILDSIVAWKVWNLEFDRSDTEIAKVVEKVNFEYRRRSSAKPEIIQHVQT